MENTGMRKITAANFGLILVVAATLSGCSSSDSAGPASTTAPATSLAPTSTPAPSTTTAEPTTTVATTPPSTAPSALTIRCDADSGENPTFDVPLGTEVTLIASSATEREYHLHGYDLELTGTTVTFQFTANIPGPSELTEHPDHTTVCAIVS